MTSDNLINDLSTLNQLVVTLNREVDVRSVLEGALEQLLALMHLETGWIFLADDGATDRQWGKGYTLAAHANLPPALALDNDEAWLGGCDCQGLCMAGKLTEAINEVRCSRLASVQGDTNGLAVHASTPLVSGERIFGILNVAATDWSRFTPASLALLTNVGAQLGIALERARLYDMLSEQRVDEQNALLSFTHDLLGLHELPALLATLVETVQRLLRLDAVALLLPDADGEDLLFSASSGWRTDPVVAERRVPGDEQSVPGRCLVQQKPFVVDDYRPHAPTMWMADWLQAEGFISYAALPLIAHDLAVGVLLINQRREHGLDEDALRLLHLLSNQAALAIEKTRLYEEALQRKKIEEELLVGRQIQMSLLPERDPEVPGWEVVSYYRPARQVGGDFYDLFFVQGRSRHLGIVVADVAGKGVPAALFMALSRTTIRASAITGRPPAQALTQSNDLLLPDNRSDMFLTAVYATLDTQTGHLTYCNAGHNPPLHMNARTGISYPLRTQGMLLGVFEGVKLEERVGEINPGDVVVFFTDGVTEAMNLANEEFGDSRLNAFLSFNYQQSAQDICRAIVGAVDAFARGAPQADDLTLVVLRREP
ncbi:MAG: SpoIIE family protein phosphatase, partial [Chloroflexi bacterium]|nr:SpoIIE family protein phosphatase [Chloroflexota bacterium]